MSSLVNGPTSAAVDVRWPNERIEIAAVNSLYPFEPGKGSRGLERPTRVRTAKSQPPPVSSECQTGRAARIPLRSWRGVRGRGEERPRAQGAVVGQSARNRFAGIVTRVIKDTVAAQVEIQAGPHRVVSLMTAEAVDELGLEPGMLAIASVKATQVVIEVTAA